MKAFTGIARQKHAVARWASWARGSSACRVIPLLSLIAVLVACTSSSTSNLPISVPPPSPSPTASTSLIQVHDSGHVTGTLPSESCQMTGSGPTNYLPDPKCNPGAIDPSIDARVLCAPGYTTSSYRPPAEETDKFKYDVAYPAYGLTKGTPAELDHLVPLTLGGANDAANLWPEPGSVPNPKDNVEVTLHRWVCDGGPGVAQGRLEAAQKAIAENWTTAAQKLGVNGG